MAPPLHPPLADLVPPATDPDVARRAADEVLARAEYREPQPSLVERALDAIGEALGRLIETLTGGGPGSIIGIVVIAALAGGALWLLARALSSGAPVAPVPGPTLRHGTSALDDPADWDREADRLAAAGDHAGALRCRYQAFVARLLRARVVPVVPGRTPRELAAQVARSWPRRRDQMDAVTERFERTWFGGAPASAEDVVAFTDTTVALARALVDEPAAVPA